MGEKGECDKERVEGGAGVRENYGKEIMKKRLKKEKKGRGGSKEGTGGLNNVKGELVNGRDVEIGELWGKGVGAVLIGSGRERVV